MKAVSLICAIAGAGICMAMTPARHGPAIMLLVGVLAFIVYAAAPWFVRIIIVQAPVFGSLLVAATVLAAWLACYVLPSGPWIYWGNPRGEPTGYGLRLAPPSGSWSSLQGRARR
jgi:hypothetical protein